MSWSVTGTESPRTPFQKGGMFAPSFEEAAQGLAGLRMLPFTDMRVDLQQAKSVMRMSRVVKELGLHEDDRLRTLTVIFDRNHYIESLLAVLGDRIPIMQDEILTSLLEEGGEVFLIPEPLGMNWFSYEEFFEVIDTPAAQFGIEKGLEVFIKCLDYTVIGFPWEECNNYFGWNLPEPPEIPKNTNFDLERMERCLRCSGMEPFFDAMDVAIGIDNTFFTFNPYSGDEPLDFTVEVFQMLEEEWKIAQMKIASTHEAQSMVSTNPDLYRKFAELWKGSFVPREERV